MKGRGVGVAAVLLAAVLVSACDDPNCFRGECPSGPTGVTTRYLTPEEEYFLHVGLAARGGTEEEQVHRFETDTVDYLLGAGLTAWDEQAARRLMDEVEALTGVTFVAAADSAPVARLMFALAPRAEIVEATGNPEAGGMCGTTLASDGSIVVGRIALAEELAEESAVREQLIRHETGHCIGLLDHATDDYPESLVHPNGPDVLEALAEVDVLAIETLYDPRLRSGMARAEVLAALGW